MKTIERMPEDLSQKLRAFERRLRVIETLVAVLAGLTGLLGALALLALLDRFVDTPPLLRVLLAVMSGAAVSFSAVWWARHWWWRRRNVRELARLVQRRYPRLGDRLLGAVELSESDMEAVGASPALVRAALRQVAEESRAYNFREAAPKRAVRRYAVVLAVLAALLMIGLIVAPEALLFSARRWLRPTAPLQRYTFTRISDLPEALIVPRGEPFELTCGIDPGSRWRPTRGVARIGDQPPVRATVQNHTVRFSFPGQTAEATLALRIGDDRRRILVRPLQRPELAEMMARIEWPDYLRREPEWRRIEGGRLSILSEARLSFQGRIARRITAARVGPETAGGSEAIEVNDSEFATTARPAAEWAARYAGATDNTAALFFEWVDEHQLSNARPYRLDLSLQSDVAPMLEVEGIRGAVAVLPDEVLTLTVRGRDDFGLAAIGWEWRVDDSEVELSASYPKNVERRAVSEDASGTARSLEGIWRLSPRLLETGTGRVVTLWAWASDHRPGREPTRVGPFRVFVLAPEEHARMVRQMMDQLSTRLEELLRGEEMQIAESDALRSLDDEALSHSSAAAAMERSEQSERANESSARQLAEDMEKLLKEALRNPQISADELQPWTAAEMALRSEVAEAMARAAAAMAKAAAASASASASASSSSSSESREHLAEANAAQREAAEALRRTSQQTERQMENALARSFVNRLKEVARVEREVAVGWGRVLSAVVGLMPEQVTAPQRVRLNELRREHDRAQRETTYIRNDLGAFFNRTRRPIFGEVYEKMREPDVLQDFAEIAALGDRIHLGRGIGTLEALADRFEKWAKMLEPENDREGGGSGGGGGGEGGLEPEVLLGMMRARVVLEMLREQTRAADEADDHADAERAARAVGERQQGLSKEFRDLSAKTRNAMAAVFLKQLAGLSDEAHERVIRPDTGSETVAVQTEIIEAIAAAMQGQGGGGRGGSSGDASASQQTAMSMGSGVGSWGGGSMAGGDTAGVKQHGGPGSGDLEAREVSRGSRPDVSTWPMEYRDAIQAYYEAVEGRL